ncbi:MAG: hypothetical protein SV375_21930 [Thermodesulfobacteriota bacterium]|nr:hypothetical protein [Thermodesulfobacteriota bacterium]
MTLEAQAVQRSSRARKGRKGETICCAGDKEKKAKPFNLILEGLHIGFGSPYR